MKLAYIAGPYRPSNGKTVLENIRAAEQVAIKYWKAGYVVICPHLNSAFFDGICDDSVWLEGYLEILRRCDVVVMVQGWESSVGSCDEHSEAISFGKEIIYDGECGALYIQQVGRCLREGDVS